MRRPAIVAAVALFAAATPSIAAQVAPGIGTNYTFPDGIPGFDLNVTLPPGDTTLATDGLLNPEVLVGFNPQPDPPGTPPTFLSLTDPADIVFSNTARGGYRFLISFLNLLPAGCDPTTIAAPDSDGRTSLSCSGDLGNENVTVDVALSFGPDTPATWVEFNPQPDPPGDVAGFNLSFPEDQNLALSISVNGMPVNFSVPEPGTLTLVGTALIGLASWRRRQRRR